MPHLKKCQFISVQQLLLLETTAEYVRLVNAVVSECIDSDTSIKHTSGTVSADLPSALKNQAIQDAKSVFKKYRKTKIRSVLKKPVAIWNNQNWTLKGQYSPFSCPAGRQVSADQCSCPDE
jgi:putative transposase